MGQIESILLAFPFLVLSDSLFSIYSDLSKPNAKFNPNYRTYQNCV